MHLDAPSHIDRSISGSAEFIQTNFFGAYTLLEAVCGDGARKVAVAFIFLVLGDSQSSCRFKQVDLKKPNRGIPYK